jgi:hypothetical protein
MMLRPWETRGTLSSAAATGVHLAGEEQAALERAAARGEPGGGLLGRGNWPRPGAGTQREDHQNWQ